MRSLCLIGFEQFVGIGIQSACSLSILKMVWHVKAGRYGVLFPAIPLAIVARNFRQRSSAGLQHELYAQIEKKFGTNPTTDSR